MSFQPQAGLALVALDAVPDYHLVKSKTVNKLLPVDWYGLFKGDTPVLGFEGPLLKDPCAGLSEDDLDSMPAMPDGYDEYQAGCQRLGQALKTLDAAARNDLTSACEELGYHADEFGELQWWLFDWLARNQQN